MTTRVVALEGRIDGVMAELKTLKWVFGSFIGIQTLVLAGLAIAVAT